MSVITLLELEQGILQIARRDARQGMALRTWLENRVLPAFTGRILPVDQHVAQCCARLHIPDPRPDRDALIAATALAYRMTVVTLDVKDFKQMGVPLLNPWT